MAEMHFPDLVRPVAATPDRSPGDGVAPARQRDQQQRKRQPHPRKTKDDEPDEDRQVGTRLDVVG